MVHARFTLHILVMSHPVTTIIYINVIWYPCTTAICVSLSLFLVCGLLMYNSGTLLAQPYRNPWNMHFPSVGFTGHQWGKFIGQQEVEETVINIFLLLLGSDSCKAVVANFFHCCGRTAPTWAPLHVMLDEWLVFGFMLIEHWNVALIMVCKQSRNLSFSFCHRDWQRLPDHKLLLMRQPKSVYSYDLSWKVVMFILFSAGWSITALCCFPKVRPKWVTHCHYYCLCIGVY